MRAPQRLTRSTAAGAVVALFVGLMLSHGPWWAQGSPSLASASPAGTTPAAAPPAAPAPAPAPAPPAADTQPQPAAPAPAPAPVAPVPAPAKAPADSIGPLTGANVTVYLRADAMGIQFSGANQEVRNLVTRKGAFVRSDDHWFIMKHESQEIWIPRSSIAMVEMRS